MPTIYEQLRKSYEDVIAENLKTDDMLSIKAFRKHYISLLKDSTNLKFYKYYKPTYFTIRNLEKDLLMCNNPSAFNDIYEGMVTSDKLDSSEVRSIITNVSSAVSISCFSETWDNLLMYAHYADSFRGFCIEYNFDYIRDRLPLLYFFPVIYQSQPVSLEQMQKLNDDINQVKAAFKEDSLTIEKIDDVISYFIHKANIWNYEREWRFIIPVTQYGNYFNSKDVSADKHFIPNFDCISAIYLAPNIDDLHKEHICEIIKKKNKERAESGSPYPPILVYQTKIQEAKYMLEKKQVVI